MSTNEAAGRDADRDTTTATASTAQGLTSADARALLKTNGPNQIYEPEKISVLRIARTEVGEPIILLLIFTGILYSIFGELRDAITIFVVIALLVASEVWTEYRAKAAIEALGKISAIRTRVRRDGMVGEIDTLEVVPHDVLILSQGTKIAADAAVGRSIDLQIDESALTGESFPVEKRSGDPVYAGTFVAAGEGEAEVVVTGARTRIGQVAAKTREIKVPRTPLQLSMRDLSAKLLWVALFFSIAIPLLGVVRGQDWRVMLLTGLALAFATIPEELPIVITMVLGLGSYRLSKNGFLVKQLRAAEALGNATVIVTDKTGTITEGRLAVASVWRASSDDLVESELDSLREDDELGAMASTADEIERLTAAARRGSDVIAVALDAASDYVTTPVDTALRSYWETLRLGWRSYPLLRERDRTGERKTRAVIRQLDRGPYLYVSGSPEEVFEACSTVPAEAAAELERQAQSGRRIIGVATRALEPDEATLPFDQLEIGLTFRGLIAFEDSPRAGVKETVATAARAGIRTIMVTGDHPLTAAFVARQVGIDATHVMTGGELDAMTDEALRGAVRTVSVFARTTPEHKYRIVRALQANHEVVAVTGDGINDVLALKAADIGIAMGLRGTDVAREAASIVLADDNFNTLASGIFEGRVLYDNLSKGMRFYLEIKAALVAIFLLPVLIGVPMPFAPVQIIVLELFMDLAASAGFTAEPAEHGIYSRPPRDPQVSVFNRPALVDIGVKAAALFVAVTAVYLFAFNHASLVEAQTLAFAAWMLGHVALAFVSRSDDDPLSRIGLLSNRVMDAWALLAVAFLLLGIYAPGLGDALKLTYVAPVSLLAVFAVVIVVILPLEVRKMLLPRASVGQRTADGATH